MLNYYLDFLVLLPPRHAPHPRPAAPKRVSEDYLSLNYCYGFPSTQVPGCDRLVHLESQFVLSNRNRKKKKAISLGS